MKFPFSVYDLIAILAPTFLFVIGVDYTLGAGWTDVEHLGAVPAMKWVLLLYVLGQIFHGISLYLFEEQISNRLIGSPKKMLLFGKTPKGLKATINRLFGECYSPFSEEIKARLERRFTADGVGALPQDRFHHSFSCLKVKKEAMDYLQTYSVMTGFYRNLAFNALLVLTFALSVLARNNNPSAAWASIGSFVVFWVMLSRYLKMNRLFIREVFLIYLRNDEPKNT